MNQRQQGQIDKIKKDLDKIIENHPELSVFVNVVKQDYIVEYAHLKRYVNTNTEIEQFIHYYLDRVKSLYDLVK